MRFTVSAAAALLAMATSVFAQTADFDPINKPNKDEVIPAGSTYTIAWDAPAKYADITVKISLIGGADQGHQVPLSDIASGVKNSAGSYAWSVGSDLGDDAVYGLVFTSEADASVFQYSKPFHIKANGGASGSASGSATGSGTTVITKSSGIKTVTLASTTVAPNTTTTFCTSTASSNSTTWAPKHSKTVVTSTALVTPSETTPATVPTQTKEAAAPRTAASSLALVGALIMAYLSL